VFGAYRVAYDVHMADPYPIPDSPITLVADWADASRLGAGSGKPTWMCLQTHNLALYGHANGRWPTPDELRCMTYLAFTHNAKGIGWWCFGHAKDSGDWHTYEELYHEIQAISPYLLSTEADERVRVTTECNHLHVSAHLQGSECLLLVANPGEAVEASFSIEGATAQTAKPLFGAGSLPIEDGHFKAAIPAVGRAAFLLK